MFFINWLWICCSHLGNLNLSLELILFGVEDNTKTDKIFDLLLLLAKFYIYKCKVQNVKLNINNFKKEVQQKYIIEKHLYYSKNKLALFFTKWSLYHSLVENLNE